MKFSVLSRFPKQEYYGPHCTDTLGEAEAFFKLGYAELKIDDLGRGILKVMMLMVLMLIMKVFFNSRR